MGWAQSGAESVVVVNKYYKGAFGMRMQRYWYHHPVHTQVTECNTVEYITGSHKLLQSRRRHGNRYFMCAHNWLGATVPRLCILLMLMR